MITMNIKAEQIGTEWWRLHYWVEPFSTGLNYFSYVEPFQHECLHWQLNQSRPVHNISECLV